ncbi:hypothetical protein [Xylophilus ampelinus]|uniref:Uncharacterized protein n=1 Tax=Xylophilus ampelinus TaxID=54067 RepID=A0A318SLD5_9BURK|nr:hypothetical protein [Xylophilus ampelinus]MCS4509146.1 hypothetical protein [Xylophilus ampelinus]PYE79826.1 hypothetical protein DFQ15_101146 [Xylophilus ampelinus]
MLTITRSGPRLGEVAAFIRDVPQGVVPYAAARALNSTAVLAQEAIKREMRSAFSGVTAYTLNSMFIVRASKENLEATVAVKNQAGAGVTPEHYLLPETDGGQRNFKRFEVALRIAGFLKPGWYVMPGRATQLDANGNVDGRTVRRVVQELDRRKAGSSLFVGKAGRSGAQGIWQRTGRSIAPLFIFTNRAPQYRKRLDFSAVAAKAVSQRFANEFYESVQIVLKRQPA